MSVSLAEQLDEIDLCILGLAEQVRRAAANEIKRQPEEVDRWRSRLAARRAIAETLRLVEERHRARLTSPELQRQGEQAPEELREQQHEQGGLL